MSDKIAPPIQRQALADYLEALAGQLRAGELTMGERVWKVPESLPFKARIKEKKGRLVIKLRLKWKTLRDYTPDERQQIEQWQENLKSVKRRMAVAFKRLHRSVQGGRMPEPDQLSEFEAAVVSFAEFAEPEWAAEMEAFSDHLENLKRAVAGGDLAIVAHELRDLKGREKACHREFK
jgi:XXXCH domain-containing protein